MEVKLVVRNGKHAGQVIPVPGPQFLIGRGPDCQLRPSHKDIGTHHCAILVEQGRVAVRDHGQCHRHLRQRRAHQGRAGAQRTATGSASARWNSRST